MAEIQRLFVSFRTFCGQITVCRLGAVFPWYHSGTESGQNVSRERMREVGVEGRTRLDGFATVEGLGACELIGAGRATPL